MKINFYVGQLTFMCRPGSSSTSCRAMSLHDFLDGMGTFPSSSQYRLGECAYNADGVACVIRVLVTTPVDFPGRKTTQRLRKKTEHDGGSFARSVSKMGLMGQCCFNVLCSRREQRQAVALNKN